MMYFVLTIVPPSAFVALIRRYILTHYILYTCICTILLWEDEATCTCIVVAMLFESMQRHITQKLIKIVLVERCQSDLMM